VEPIEKGAGRPAIANMENLMTTRKSCTATIAFAFAATALMASFDTRPAQAQSWSYDRYERAPGAHRWGPRCVDRITTRGKAGVKLFSNCKTKGLRVICTASAHPCR
jgi:hypothetical protein